MLEQSRPEMRSVKSRRSRLWGSVSSTSVVAAISVTLCGTALAAHAGRLQSLRAAEAAFYRAGLPFRTEWTPNPYIVVAPGDDPRELVSPSVRRHLIGFASGGSSITFKTWSVWVFDQAPPAIFYARWSQRRCKPPQCNGATLRANNVVYFGARLSAAVRAMTKLRQQ